MDEHFPAGNNASGNCDVRRETQRPATNTIGAGAASDNRAIPARLVALLLQVGNVAIAIEQGSRNFARSLGAVLASPRSGLCGAHK
jgi:hypothetical protein